MSRAGVGGAEDVRVIVCGSRNWTNRDVIRRELQALPAHAIVVHGNCRGADRIAGRIALSLGLITEPYPADWTKHGKAAGPIRNQQMLDTGVDLVLAFHDDLESSKGTKDMATRARAAGVPVQVIAGAGRKA